MPYALARLSASRCSSLRFSTWSCTSSRYVLYSVVRCGSLFAAPWQRCSGTTAHRCRHPYAEYVPRSSACLRDASRYSPHLLDTLRVYWLLSQHSRYSPHLLGTLAVASYTSTAPRYSPRTRLTPHSYTSLSTATRSSTRIRVDLHEYSKHRAHHIATHTHRGTPCTQKHVTNTHT